MSAFDGNSLRNCWIANAKKLDEAGYFAKYSPEQRAEVLKKGFLGCYPPDQAIKIAREQTERGHAVRKDKFNDEMRSHFELVGEEVRETSLKILNEVPPESYKPPYELEEPPGVPFIYLSRVLGREIFFKFQITGKPQKPQVLFWSCHPPLYGRKKL